MPDSRPPLPGPQTQNGRAAGRRPAGFPMVRPPGAAQAAPFPRAPGAGGPPLPAVFRFFRVVLVGVPRGLIFRRGLIAPHGPALPVSAGKQLKKRPRRAALDQGDEFVRFSGVLPLLCPEQIHLGPGRGQRPVPAAPNAKEQDFRHVPEVEPHAPAVRFSVLADLLPDDIALVLESPGLHDRKAVGKQGIGDPQIQMALLRRHLRHRQRHDVFQLHGLVAIQPLVLRRYLPGPILESPGGIGIYGGVFLIAAEAQQIFRCFLDCAHRCTLPPNL